jgi:hypothetical protein
MEADLRKMWEALKAGLPTDHTNRTDARITALEQSVLAIYQWISQMQTPIPPAGKSNG